MAMNTPTHLVTQVVSIDIVTIALRLILAVKLGALLILVQDELEFRRCISVAMSASYLGI